MRWMMIVGTGVMPAFVLRCDKAALNFQREFVRQLGVLAADAVFDPDLLALNSGT